jgi:hypothetical protein
VALTFKQYLRVRPATKSDVGQLVSAIRRDRRLRPISGWTDLERYLVRIAAEPDTRATARRLWLAYQAAIRA